MKNENLGPKMVGARSQEPGGGGDISTQTSKFTTKDLTIHLQSQEN